MPVAGDQPLARVAIVTVGDWQSMESELISKFVGDLALYPVENQPWPPSGAVNLAFPSDSMQHVFDTLVQSVIDSQIEGAKEAGEMIAEMDIWVSAEVV